MYATTKVLNIENVSNDIQFKNRLCITLVFFLLINTDTEFFFFFYYLSICLTII